MNTEVTVNDVGQLKAIVCLLRFNPTSSKDLQLTWQRNVSWRGLVDAKCVQNVLPADQQFPRLSLYDELSV